MISGFDRVAPETVVALVPGIVMVDRGSLMDLSKAQLISLHLSFPFYFLIS